MTRTRLFGTKETFIETEEAAIGTATAICFGALAPAAEAGTVCNEAENSYRGGYVVSGGIVDPVPPAFLRGSQMSVGNGGVGINNAADRSPALRQCAAEDGDGDDGGTT